MDRSRLRSTHVEAFVSNACAGARRGEQRYNASVTIEVNRRYLFASPQIVGHVWIFRRQRFDIADFDVDFLYA